MRELHQPSLLGKLIGILRLLISPASDMRKCHHRLFPWGEGRCHSNLAKDVGHPPRTLQSQSGRAARNIRPAIAAGAAMMRARRRRRWQSWGGRGASSKAWARKVWEECGARVSHGDQPLSLSRGLTTVAARWTRRMSSLARKPTCWRVAGLVLRVRVPDERIVRDDARTATEETEPPPSQV